jgi:hypothetical protein
MVGGADSLERLAESRVGEATPKRGVDEEDQPDLQADPKYAGLRVDRSGVRQIPPTSTPWSRRKHRRFGAG